MSREDLSRDRGDLIGVVEKLREMVDELDKDKSGESSSRVRSEKAMRVARDVVDSTSWMKLEEDAKPEAKEEREARLAEIAIVAKYMGEVTETNEAMTSRYGQFGWDLILWAWGIRETFANVRTSFNRLNEEANHHVQDIVRLKSDVIQADKKVNKALLERDQALGSHKKLTEDKDRLYQELKTLREPKVRIEKAESKVENAKREAKIEVDAADARTQKVKEELAKYKEVSTARFKAYEASNKRMAEENADLVNKMSDMTRKFDDKYDKKVKALNDAEKKLKAIEATDAAKVPEPVPEAASQEG